MVSEACEGSDWRLSYIVFLLVDFVPFLEYFKFDKENRAFEIRRATRREELGRLPLDKEPEESPAECAVRIGRPGRTSSRTTPSE